MQSAKYHEETTSNLWTVGVREIILSSFIFPSKSTDLRRNKLDILIPVMTTAFQLLFGLQHFNSCPDDSVLIPALSFTTVFFLQQLTEQGFLLSQSSPLKTINISVNAFIIYFLPFYITRGNRTLQP